MIILINRIFQITEFQLKKNNKQYIKKHGKQLNMDFMRLGQEQKRLIKIISLRKHFYKINKFTLRITLLQSYKKLEELKKIHLN